MTEFTIQILREYRHTEHLASLRAWHALMLAPTLPTWRTLLRGEHVPEDQLDRDMLRRARQRLRT